MSRSRSRTRNWMSAEGLRSRGRSWEMYVHHKKILGPPTCEHCKDLADRGLGVSLGSRGRTLVGRSMFTISRFWDFPTCENCKVSGHIRARTA